MQLSPSHLSQNANMRVSDVKAEAGACFSRHQEFEIATSTTYNIQKRKLKLSESQTQSQQPIQETPEDSKLEFDPLEKGNICITTSRPLCLGSRSASP